MHIEYRDLYLLDHMCVCVCVGHTFRASYKLLDSLELKYIELLGCHKHFLKLKSNEIIDHQSQIYIHR